MTGNDKSNGPGFLLEKELSLEELLEITAAGPSYDEAKARRAIMKIVAGAERFCNEVRRILLKPHETSEAERRDGLMEFIACTSQFSGSDGGGPRATRQACGLLRCAGRPLTAAWWTPCSR